MTKTVSIAALLLLVCRVSVASPSMTEQGQELHDAHCQGCHKSEVYLRGDRKVNDFAQLMERIKYCEGANKLQWSERQVKMVATYLNSAYYKFAK